MVIVLGFLSAKKIPEDIRTRIEAEQNGEILREWYMNVPQL